MKKLIPVIALLIGGYGAFGQGVVNFRNENLQPPPNRLITMPDMATGVIGTTFAAQLYYGTDPASLTPHPTLAYFRASLTPGTWSGGNRTLTGIAAPPQPTPAGPGMGPVIWLQVRAWDSGTGRTMSYDQARAQGGLWGESLVYSYQQLLSSPPDTADAAMRNFVGFSLVPEPSVIGLGLIGIGALFMLRRRKA
jgi:hypothetical protein